MADQKTQRMAQFFETCQQKGYTDMSDPTQSLKAKVIATDLNLNYGNIAAFYEKAKESYELIQIENAAKERQQKKEAQEAARRAVDGALLVTVTDSRNRRRGTQMKVFLRPDETIYCTVDDGEKIEGAPAITLHQGGVLLTTYHPSKAVYTGATVGGITTGGVHYTKESYSQKVTHSGKGYIQVKAGDTEFTVAVITPSEETANRFRRDEAYKKLADCGSIYCYQDSVAANMYANYAMTGAKDFASRMDAASFAAEERRLPMSECVEIRDLLGRMVNAEFPPTDEEAYAAALALSKSKTAAELKQALDLFRSISDFRDAEARADAVETVYEEILQAEKEAAILAKEAAHKKWKKRLAIVIPSVVALIALCVGLFFFVRHRQEQAKLQAAYQEAMTLWEQGEYDAAMDAFRVLGDYQDAAAQVIAVQESKEEAARLAAYNQAMSLAEAGDFAAAAEQFEQLGDYKDSVQQAQNARLESDYQQALAYLDAGQENHSLAYELFTQLGDYKDAAVYAGGFTERIILETVEGGRSRQENPYLYDENGYDATKTWSEDHRKAVFTNNGDTITIEYDEQGNMVYWASLNANGAGYINRYVYTFNEDGTVQSCSHTRVFAAEEETPESESFTTYEYDGDGLLRKTVETETLEYDRKEGNSPSRITTCEYSYDAFGRIIGITEDSVLYSYGYSQKTTTYQYTYTYTYGWVYTPGAQK